MFQDGLARVGFAIQPYRWLSRLCVALLGIGAVSFIVMLQRMPWQRWRAAIAWVSEARARAS